MLHQSSWAPYLAVWSAGDHSTNTVYICPISTLPVYVKIVEQWDKYWIAPFTTIIFTVYPFHCMTCRLLVWFGRALQHAMQLFILLDMSCNTVTTGILRCWEPGDRLSAVAIWSISFPPFINRTRVAFSSIIHGGWKSASLTSCLLQSQSAAGFCF